MDRAFDRDVRAGAARAQQIDGAISRDAHQPRGRRPQQCVVGIGTRPHSHECFLQHFFRVGRVAENPHNEAVSEAAVSVVELCQRGFVADGDALEEAKIDLRTAGFHG